MKIDSNRYFKIRETTKPGKEKNGMSLFLKCQGEANLIARCSFEHITFFHRFTGR